MTETERKAMALVNEVMRERGHGQWETLSREREALSEALCRAIEQHEAFRQEVSDAMKLLSEEHEAFRQEVSDALEKRGFYIDDRDLGRFIIAKPDPLVEAIADYKRTKGTGEYATNKDMADAIRVALAARGLKIVEDK